MPRYVQHILFIVAPVVVAFALLPGVYNNQLLLFNFVLFLTLAQGVNVIYGFTGYLPFGYVGFFGAGTYGFSLLVMHLQAPPLLALLAAGVAALLLGLLLTPLLRLSGAYFSIANLAASLAVLHFISNPNLESVTRGPYGVSLSGIFNPKLAYGLAVAVMAGAMLVVVWLRNSRFGLALQAVREDSVSAAQAGVDVSRARAVAWLLSAVIAGFAGGVFVVVRTREARLRLEHRDLRHRLRAVRRRFHHCRSYRRRAHPLRRLQPHRLFDAAVFPAHLRRIDHAAGAVPAAGPDLAPEAEGDRCPLTPSWKSQG